MKKIIKWPIAVCGLTIGLIIYVLFRKTPAFAYQSMIHLFCLSKGRSNDLLSRLIGVVKPKYNLDSGEGLPGFVGEQERRVAVRDLREHGYHVFAQRLPEDVCDRLLRYATTHNCKMRPMDGHAPEEARIVVYPRGTPQTVRYDFSPQDLLANPDVQRLLADLSFAAIAEDYLGARPVVDVLSMWWHTAYSDKPDMDAAQYYHFDMDRPKWLKFFIYLTDVSSENGPHFFIEGSHKTEGIPEQMLTKGYARLTDEEVEAHYGKERVVEYTAPRGTIIAEDTRGLHKGKHVERDDRLILQIQFSNTLFGGYYPKARIEGQVVGELRASIEKYPELYSSYT